MTIVLTISGCRGCHSRRRECDAGSVDSGHAGGSEERGGAQAAANVPVAASAAVAAAGVPPRRSHSAVAGVRPTAAEVTIAPHVKTTRNNKG